MVALPIGIAAYLCTAAACSSALLIPDFVSLYLATFETQFTTLLSTVWRMYVQRCGSHFRQM
jgi:hypothetical protein